LLYALRGHLGKLLFGFFSSQALFLLLLVTDNAFHDFWPEVSLEIGQLGSRLKLVLYGLLVDVLVLIMMFSAMPWSNMFLYQTIRCFRLGIFLSGGWR